MIKVSKSPSGKSSKYVYVIDKDNTKKLEIILKQYGIKIPKTCCSNNRLLFWECELDEITKQYKLARKQERQTK